jgi:hypothetical protein
MGDAWPFGNSFNGRMTTIDDVDNPLREEVYLHLEEVEYLAENWNWTVTQQAAARVIIPDLVTTIRGLIRLNANLPETCPDCGAPCPRVEFEAIHQLVKNPDEAFSSLRTARH